MKHGRGVYTFPDSEQYAGQYKRGRMHGRGVYRFANGDTYEGEYREDLFHGVGRFTWADGRMFVFIFYLRIPRRNSRTKRNNRDHESKTECFPFGSFRFRIPLPCHIFFLLVCLLKRYTGEYVEGKSHGIGRMTRRKSDGSVDEVYRGHFKEVCVDVSSCSHS